MFVQLLFYETVVGPTMFCGLQCWIVKKKCLKNECSRNKNAKMDECQYIERGYEIVVFARG